MSRGGKWRRVFQVMRAAALGTLIGGFLWGSYMAALSLRKTSPRIPGIAKLVPMKAPELRTTRDGVLDNTWLARTLELPPKVALLELDLEKLLARVQADEQVMTASLRRVFPDRLIVQVTERTPVARVRIGDGGAAHDLLVARDGVIFSGSCFDPAMIATLPWLAGFALETDGGGFKPIARMPVVARLLTDAQLAADHLYRGWQNVSLARLDMDNEIEITTRDHTTIVFSAKGAFFVQLANLDYIMERRMKLPGMRARIDLSLGREVPVMIEPLAATIETKPELAKGAMAPFFPALPGSQLFSKREL